MRIYPEIRQRFPGIKIVVVSKGRSIQEIKSFYEMGARDFGESRVSEFLEKRQALPSEIRWHFIGTLQSNKVKHVVGKVELIHSVDCLSLAKEISKRAVAAGVTQQALLQVNISGESQKHGMTPLEALQFQSDLQQLEGVKWEGLMTMAPYTDDEKRIRSCFQGLKSLQQKLGYKELSMGMSQDYQIAIEEGATIIRLGRALFGP